MQNAINHIRFELSAYYTENELQSVVRLLISNITGFSFTEILVNKNTIFYYYFYYGFIKQQILPIIYMDIIRGLVKNITNT